MLEFFLMFLFSKSIFLTGLPINITTEDYVIEANEVLSAINEQASIDIVFQSSNLSLESIEKEFPSGTVQAKIIFTDGSILIMQDVGYGQSKNEVFLILRNSEIPKKKKFKIIKILSGKPINNVKIRWKNCAE